ncbi:MAG: hypothetical protein GY950_15630, partial [bacterium]|nr:hypothetical protein [bacterium]
DRSGQYEKSTAGAVGMVKRTADHLLAVGSWDSDTVDFYTSNGKAPDDPDCSFSLEWSWDKNNVDKTGWIDENWAKYQGLNLLSQPGGELFLIGFNRNAAGKDWADLYALDTTAAPEKMLRKIDKLHVTCCYGASFRWGGGVFCANDSNIALYASERDIHQDTAYNQFWF